MNKEEAEKVVKDTIEYANQEIKKSKIRYLKIFLVILGILVLLIISLKDNRRIEDVYKFF